MSTLRTSENFLRGAGLNLALPIHRDDTRALVLQNWRVDRMKGRLKSRSGVGNPLHDYGDPIHTTWLHNGSNRYVGAGTALYRDTTSILTGLDGKRLFLAGTRGFVWIMNQLAQKKDNGTSVTDWGVAAPGSAPSVAVGAGGNITGNVLYAVSFEDSDGFEGNIGPLSAVVTLASQQADLSSIPLGGASIAKRHIYRNGGGLEDFYRVATINDNSTTIYSDNTTNEEAELLEIFAPTNRFPPPTASGTCHYMGGLVVWNTPDAPNGLFWDGGGPWYFPPGNATRVGDHAEPIFACSEIDGCLYIAKQRSIWRAVGPLSDKILERVTAEIGIPGASAIAINRDIIPYLSRRGAFIFNGDRSKKASEALDPLFNGEGVPTGAGAALQAINLQALDAAVVEVSDNRAYFSFPGSVATTPTQTAILDLATGEWSQDSRGFTAMNDEGPGGQFTVAIGSKLFSMDNGLEDDGVDIPVVYQSAFWDCGFADNDKQVYELTIEHSLGVEVFSVKYFKNRDITTAIPFTPVTTFNANGISRFKFNGDEGITVENISILIEGNVDTEVEITKITLAYMVLPRRTRQYVSEVLSEGQAQMWEARAAMVDLDYASVDATLAVLADGALNGDMVGVDYPLTHEPGDPKRRAVKVVFGSLRRGRLWQNAVRSTGDIRVYGTKLEMRPIPMFLGNPAGETYEDSIITLGV